MLRPSATDVSIITDVLITTDVIDPTGVPLATDIIPGACGLVVP